MDEQDSRRFTRSTYFYRVKKLASYITVEPITILYLQASLMNMLTNQNLNLEKSCRVDLHYNSTVCDAMARRDPTGYSKLEEIEVQKLATKMVALRSLFVGSIPVLLLLFVGSWSDKHSRRKPVILFPICCDIVGCVCLFLCAHFFMEVPVIVSTLSDAVPFAIGGAWCCYFTGVFSYVGQHCKEKGITTTVGILTMINAISMTGGTILAGILLRPLGYKLMYTLSFSLMVTALLYGSLRLKNPKERKREKGGHKKSFTECFGCEHAKNTVKVFFKKSPNRKRTKMIILMLLTANMVGASCSEHSLRYLYTRLKFGWDERIFSMYNTYHFVLQILGTTIALTIFSKYMGISDPFLGIISMSCQIVASIIFAISPSTLVFCIGGLLESFHGTGSIAMRSILSKTIPPEELGRANSLIGLCEATVPLVFVPVYSAIYNSTMKRYPGCHYLLSAAIFLMCLVLFWWIRKIIESEKADREKDFEDGKSGNLLEVKEIDAGE